MESVFMPSGPFSVKRASPTMVMSVEVLVRAGSMFRAGCGRGIFCELVLASTRSADEALAEGARMFPMKEKMLACEEAGIPNKIKAKISLP